MMIHITGYDADTEECFQGIGGGELTATTTVNGTGTGTGGPAIGEPYPETSLPIAPTLDEETGNVWYDLLTKCAGIFSPELTGLTADANSVVIPPDVVDEDGEARSIRASRGGVWGLVPFVAKAATLATLPPPIQAAAGLAIKFFQVKNVIDSTMDNLDQASPATRMRQVVEKLEKIGEAVRDSFLRYGLDPQGGVDFTVSRLKDLQDLFDEAFLHTAVDLDLKQSWLEDIKDALGDEEANKKLVEAIEALQLEVEFADGKASFKRGVFEYAGY